MVSKFDPFVIHDIFIYRKPNLKVIPILLVDSDVLTTKEIFYLQNDNMQRKINLILCMSVVYDQPWDVSWKILNLAKVYGNELIHVSTLNSRHKLLYFGKKNT